MPLGRLRRSRPANPPRRTRVWPPARLPKAGGDRPAAFTKQLYTTGVTLSRQGPGIMSPPRADSRTRLWPQSPALRGLTRLRKPHNGLLTGRKPVTTIQARGESYSAGRARGNSRRTCAVAWEKADSVRLPSAKKRSRHENERHTIPRRNQNAFSGGVSLALTRGNMSDGFSFPCSCIGEPLKDTDHLVNVFGANQIVRMRC